jgi:hypothetical protein
VTADAEFTFARTGAGDTIRVEDIRCAFVLLLDESNYRAFRAGRVFRGLGGYYRRSPVFFSLPAGGEWHVLIDSGGMVGGGSRATHEPCPVS